MSTAGCGGCFNFLWQSPPSRAPSSAVARPEVCKDGLKRYLQFSTPLSAVKKFGPEERHVDGTSSVFKGACPCCWRPVDVRLWDDGWRPPPAPQRVGEPRRAYVVGIWGESLDYAVGAVALAQSIVAAGTKYEFVCLHTADVPEWPHRAMLRRFFRLKLVQHVDSVPTLFSGDKETSRFKHVFTKLHMMSLVEYEKICFLDTDTLVLRSIDDLFDLPAPAAMRRGMNLRSQISHGDPIDGRFFFADDAKGDWAWGQGTGINAGVMLVAPDWQTYSRMLYEISCDQHPAHVRGNGPEQDYLSRFWADAPWTHIGVEYNFQVHQMYHALSPLCSDAAERTAVLERDGGFQHIRLVHFSGELKPWHRHFGIGPRLDLEGFVKRVLQKFPGWWLWVKKDPDTWKAINYKTDEGLELGADGKIYFSWEDKGVQKWELASDQTHLHNAAADFILHSQKLWDDAWEAVQAAMSKEELESVWHYDRGSDRCFGCKSILGQRVDSRQQQETRRWCSQCWWKFEEASGSRVSVAAWPTGVWCWIDGFEVPLNLPKGLASGAPWLFFLDLENREGGRQPIWILGDRGGGGDDGGGGGGAVADFAPLKERLATLAPGCAVVVAAWGWEARPLEGPWCLLQACGGPDRSETDEKEQCVFAMIGVRGLHANSATRSAALDVVRASRKIHAKLRTWEARGGETVAA
mmetsp:Transcript_127813/g.409300  ORF Transcript_127813/g.409300 Transcript_127813/m.409300 type:complete len:691 (+) Transcript_127813:231-2303(+)